MPDVHEQVHRDWGIPPCGEVDGSLDTTTEVLHQVQDRGACRGLLPRKICFQGRAHDGRFTRPTLTDQDS